MAGYPLSLAQAPVGPFVYDNGLTGCPFYYWWPPYWIPPPPPFRIPGQKQGFDPLHGQKQGFDPIPAQKQARFVEGPRRPPGSSAPNPAPLTSQQRAWLRARMLKRRMQRRPW